MVQLSRTVYKVLPCYRWRMRWVKWVQERFLSQVPSVYVKDGITLVDAQAEKKQHDKIMEEYCEREPDHPMLAEAPGDSSRNPRWKDETITRIWNDGSNQLLESSKKTQIITKSIAIRGPPPIWKLLEHLVNQVADEDERVQRCVVQSVSWHYAKDMLPDRNYRLGLDEPRHYGGSIPRARLDNQNSGNAHGPRGFQHVLCEDLLDFAHGNHEIFDKLTTGACSRSALQPIRNCVPNILRRLEFRAVRSFHASAVVSKLNRAGVLTKMTRKIAKVGAKMERKFREREKYRPPDNLTLESLGKSAVDKTPWSATYMREHEPRRVKMVENLLLDRISDLLSTDEFSQNFLDLPVVITGVQIDRKKGQVNVMWSSSGDREKDAVIYRTLQRLTPLLRDGLCSQHVLGQVPRIEFMLDKMTLSFKELEDKLTKADYGPSDDLEFDTSRDVLEVTVEANLRTGVTASVTGKLLDPLRLDHAPEVRTDVGGVDRKALLDSLTGAHRQQRKKPVQESL